jgi:hypothetical protein
MTVEVWMSEDEAKFDPEKKLREESGCMDVVFCQVLAEANEVRVR